eukprot:TRINITY_DN1011_c0_g2_i1.p1 TRINITY_DN1011_c0_g2~~TRINITY_DN1011_c0_g2_i1.p1  ORF type:complete len:87 (+),score=6.68 TRINITY_DN1011_c0_g2_i1:156-416(+)
MTIMQKMKYMFDVALKHGHDSLVLSAFGCGAFQNPPNHIARLFQEVIQEYQGCFKMVSFAILDDHNANRSHNPDGNYKPFKDVFDK